MSLKPFTDYSPIRGWAAVLMEDPDGRVLMLKDRDGGWRIPGGGLLLGEMPHEAAFRLAEECTGHKVRVGSMLGYTMSPALAEEDPITLGFVYRSEPLSMDDAMGIRLDPGAHCGYMWGPLAGLAEVIPEQREFLAGLVNANGSDGAAYLGSLPV